MKKTLSLLITIIVLIPFSGCMAVDDALIDLRSSIEGLPMVVQTYDESARVLDYMEGKSIDITSDSSFAPVSGTETISKSQVLSLTIGGKPVYHVGSSLIAYDSALVDYFNEVPDRVEFLNEDSSTPFISRLKYEFERDWSGHKMIILVRSQNGTPLATFIGDEVRISATEVDKSTSVFIDGMRLFIYRCDYTIYDMSLIQ